MEHGPDDLVLLQHDGDGLVFVNTRLVLIGLGILREGVLEILGNADVVHDKAGGFVAKDAIDAGDGLHQAVAAHRLVHIHGVHAGRIEAGQPHIADNHEFERIARVLSPLRHKLAAGLGTPADMRLPVWRV
jgi:hypothetical protein